MVWYSRGLFYIIDRSQRLERRNLSLSQAGDAGDVHSFVGAVGTEGFEAYAPLKPQQICRLSHTAIFWSATSESPFQLCFWGRQFKLSIVRIPEC